MKKVIVKRAVWLGLIVAAVGLSGGCASTAKIDEVRALAEEARSAAERAQQTANSAQATADRAAREAGAAKEQAAAANSCCERTSEKLDRMFKKSMHK